MIPMRDSPADKKNERLKPSDPAKGQGNLAWFRATGESSGILLLGGTSLVDFRLRVAQSQLRSDLSPSYWSLCGLLADADGTFLSVPLQPPLISAVPAINAVQVCNLSDYDDSEAWPNIAVLRFAKDPSVVIEHAKKVQGRRTVIDLPELLLAWLAFGWAAGNADNPLLHGRGIPSAAFVETAYALAGIELTPGLSSAASCPEAIWQAVKWWHEYYQEAEKVGGGADAGVIVPQGQYGLRQRSAAVKLGEDAPLWIAARMTAPPGGGTAPAAGAAGATPAGSAPAPASLPSATPRRTTRSSKTIKRGPSKA